jgi:hypothetical protein
MNDLRNRTASANPGTWYAWLCLAAIAAGITLAIVTR